MGLFLTTGDASGRGGDGRGGEGRVGEGSFVCLEAEGIKDVRRSNTLILRRDERRIKHLQQHEGRRLTKSHDASLRRNKRPSRVWRLPKVDASSDLQPEAQPELQRESARWWEVWATSAILSIPATLRTHCLAPTLPGPSRFCPVL